ncbi:DUF305 domain-containing protein [Sphingobium sp. GW456-12-10-14-TSB1]|uniref:DUF305 domain-containing protein n=2 Tax=Alphaproteobacteria TaxID=28211 RepID=UPI0009EC0BBC|nr:DUF305 domain-containing protein [Sphingobium sp.]OUC57092.1 DUF305 domain-containing protein [Sphingobium sp. GW456-12-10-14-TSB1]PZU05181.1 MAG: DUF305 domain-containing protein [Sphingobium sp.]
MKRSGMAFAPLLLLAAGPVLAQEAMHGMDHGKMGHSDTGMMKPTPANPYPRAEMEMHRKMMSAVGTDATETWARKMIEHHRGAIAMSQIVLRQAPDAKTRQMAQKSIAEQNKSIGELQAMLRSMGKRPQ